MLEYRKRVQYVTRHYTALQGLVWVIVGALLLVANAWRLWLVPHGVPFATTLTILLALVTAMLLMLLWFLTQKYYIQNFGVVQSETKDRYVALTKQSGIFILCLLTDTLDRNIHPPVSLLALMLSVAFLLYWWQMGRVQLHYLLCVPVLAFVGLLPVLSPILHTPAYIVGVDPYWGIVGVTVGIIFIVCGLLDHLLLVRTLASLARQNRAGTIPVEQEPRRVE